MRLRLTDLALPLVALAALLSACGGSDTPAAPEPIAAMKLTGAGAKAAAPGAPATLSLVPDTTAARTQLAYADVPALAEVEGIDAAAVTRAVFGTLDLGDRDTAVRVGDELFEPGAAPERSAITPVGMSAVQSCLGDALIQNTFGPDAVGRDAALGAGIGRNGDALELRICGAPHFLREIHRMERLLVAEYGDEVAGENEIGEREIAQATVPLDDVDPQDVVAILAGGTALTSRSWLASKKATSR